MYLGSYYSVPRQRSFTSPSIPIFYVPRMSPSTNSSDDNKNIWPVSERPTSFDPSMLHQDDVEWNSLFSAPLNPSVFATLAANGVFPVPRPDHSRHYTDHWSHRPQDTRPRRTLVSNPSFIIHNSYFIMY
jgi:hypothetical protein